MVRTSVVQLIFFIALVGVTAMAVGSVVTDAGPYAQALDDESDREATAIKTDLSIINDADADGNYDGEVVTLYAKNVGGETVGTDDLEVLVNGEYATVTSAEVIDGDRWREGRVAELEVEIDLDPDDHRVAIRIDGDRDHLEFRYRVAFWSDEQDEALVEDNSSYLNRTESTVVDLGMETDPGQDGEAVEYSTDSDLEPVLDPETGETDAAGENTTTLDFSDVEEGGTVEVTLDTGWDEDVITIEHRLAFWLDHENQTDPALSYNETDDVYEVDNETDSFDVTMGTDPELEGEGVTYEVNDSSVMGFDDGAEGTTNESGQNTTTLSLEEGAEPGDAVEIDLDAGWDTDAILVRVVE